MGELSRGDKFVIVKMMKLIFQRGIHISLFCDISKEFAKKNLSKKYFFF